MLYTIPMSDLLYGPPCKLRRGLAHNRDTYELLFFVPNGNGPVDYKGKYRLSITLRRLNTLLVLPVWVTISLWQVRLEAPTSVCARKPTSLN